VDSPGLRPQPPAAHAQSSSNTGIAMEGFIDTSWRGNAERWWAVKDSNLRPTD